MTNRKTSLYTIDLPKADEARLQKVIAQLPVPHQGSGFSRTSGYVQFRAENDDTARNIAIRGVRSIQGFSLRTGLGAHLRFICRTDGF